MHLTEARLFIKFLAGASLLMSFHLGGHSRPGYDVTHSSFLAGCTRRLPSILAYHYHTHRPAAWTIISKYMSKLRWFYSCIHGREFNNKKLVAPSSFRYYRQRAVQPILQLYQHRKAFDATVARLVELATLQLRFWFLQKILMFLSKEEGCLA